MNNQLKNAYNPETFRALGHELIDLLANHLEQTINGKSKVMNWKTPTEQLRYWQDNLGKEQSLKELFSDILNNSTAIHHPKYAGHQVGATVPVAALADLLGALINNGMAIYEMGAASSAIEKVVTELICRQIGYDNESDGFITSGGSLANLTALLAARKAKSDKDTWMEGNDEKLGVMVSSEAHYCIDRALRIMGFGNKGIIKIPVNKNFSMNTDLLEENLQAALKQGIKVIAVAGSAPSTATGMYDNLLETGRFCKKHNLWFHVDGAHGGAAIFSSKYRHLLHGLEMADSVVIDAHKMMMTPVLTTFLLFKNKNHSYATFNQNAQYLFSQQGDEEWYNYAKRTFECTKLMMGVRFYAIIKAHGTNIFDEFVTRQYDIGRAFAKVINQHPAFELLLPPDSNIICFRYRRKNLSEKSLNNLNATLRQRILEDGKFYIVQTQIAGNTWFRISIMSPFTEIATLEELLQYITELADNDYAQVDSDTNGKDDKC